LTLYAYSFFFGGVLRWNEVESLPGKVYSAGTVITCMFCVVFGALQVGGCAPHLRAVSEGRVAGRMAFSAIDHIPSIKVNEDGQPKIDKS
jgi:hypothetical protein